MTYAERIRTKLTAALAPTSLDVVDESRRHAGHAGAHPAGETHFKVTIVSQAFCRLSRVERQRLAHDALREELAERVHALSLKIYTPQEFAQKQG